MRCIKANRTCRGYEDSVLSAFQQYGTQSSSQSSSSPSFTATPLKCSLPKRVPIPGTDILPEDQLPAEVTEEESDVLALRAFVYDSCIVSTNQNLSGGFLSGLEKMAQQLGPKSNLVKACQAVAYANHGKPLNRPQLVDRAKLIYQELLGSFARAMESPASVNSRESKFIAMILGLYQVPLYLPFRIDQN